jgi:zinc protease
MEAQLKNFELQPMVAFTDTFYTAAYGNNPRHKRITVEELREVSYPRVLEIYRERFADASQFVFTFVGDFNTDSLCPLIEQYIASLPALHRKEQPNVANAPATRKGIYSNNFHRAMETPKATVLHLYTGDMRYTLDNTLRSTLLSRILTLIYTRTVREEQGGSYGVRTAGEMSMFPEEVSLQIYYDTSPDKADKMEAIVEAELKKLAKEGPDTEDFTVASDNMKKSFDEEQQENSYWLSVIQIFYRRGIDMKTDYLKAMDKMTPADVCSFADDLLRQNNRIDVIMQP